MISTGCRRPEPALIPQGRPPISQPAQGRTLKSVTTWFPLSCGSSVRVAGRQDPGTHGCDCSETTRLQRNRPTRVAQSRWLASRFAAHRPLRSAVCSAGGRSLRPRLTCRRRPRRSGHRQRNEGSTWIKAPTKFGSCVAIASLPRAAVPRGAVRRFSGSTATARAMAAVARSSPIWKAVYDCNSIATEPWLGSKTRRGSDGFSPTADLGVQPHALVTRPQQAPPIYQRGLAASRRVAGSDPANAVYRIHRLERRRSMLLSAISGESESSLAATCRSRRTMVSRPATNQWIGIIDAGVNIIVDGLPDFGTIDVSTDRLVIWTTASRNWTFRPDTAAERSRWRSTWKATSSFARGSGRSMPIGCTTTSATSRHGARRRNLHPRAQLRRQGAIAGRTCSNRPAGAVLAKTHLITSSLMGRPAIASKPARLPSRIFSGRLSIRRPAADGRSRDRRTVGRPRTLLGEEQLLYVGEVPIFYWPRLPPTYPADVSTSAAHAGTTAFRMQVLTDLGRLSALRHPKSAGRDRLGLQPRLPQQARFRPRHDLYVSVGQLPRDPRPHGGIGRLLGHLRRRADNGWARIAAIWSRKRTTATGCSGSIGRCCPTTTNCRPRSAGSATASSCSQYFGEEWDDLRNHTKQYVL